MFWGLVCAKNKHFVCFYFIFHNFLYLKTCSHQFSKEWTWTRPFTLRTNTHCYCSMKYWRNWWNLCVNQRLGISPNNTFFTSCFIILTSKSCKNNWKKQKSEIFITIWNVQHPKACKNRKQTGSLVVKLVWMIENYQNKNCYSL